MSFPDISKWGKIKDIKNQQCCLPKIAQCNLLQEDHSLSEDFKQPQQIIVQLAHDHPINYHPYLNEECKLCKEKIVNEPGYKCGICSFSLCHKCSNKIFCEGKHRDFHFHPLILLNNSFWTCDICKKNNRKGDSFCCKKCKFNICINCYILN